LVWRGVPPSSFSDNQRFDSREIAGIDIPDNAGKKGRNLLTGIQEKAYAKTIATIRRNAVITVQSAKHYLLKSVLESRVNETTDS
jgi:hypothetical protein